MEQRILHLICVEGTCSLHFAGEHHVLKRGSCFVAVDTHVHHICPSENARIHTIHLTPKEHAALMPDTPWGVCGEFHFFTNPLFEVDDETLKRLDRDMEELSTRKKDSPSEYDQIAWRKAAELFYTDLVRAHEALFCVETVSKSYATIMNRFINLLKQGAYKRNRTVGFYASELCITPKHLHKVCRQISGQAPRYWIQRFTIMEARFLLHHEKKTQKEIAQILGFDCVAHFSRYVSSIEGTTPGKIQ